jgi:hypothetical protein
MSDLTSSAADQNSPERDEATAAYSPEIIENIYQKATGPSDNNPGGVPEQDETAAPAGGDDDKPSTAGKGGDEDKPRKIGRGEALLTSDAVKALDEADERLTREQGEVVRGGVKDIERMMAKMNSRPLPQMDKTPNAPEANFTQNIGPFLGMATALMAIAGSRARQGGTVALNAFAGAIKGWKEGRQDEFQAKTAEFKMAAEKVKEDNQEKLDQYKMAWSNDKLNIDQKMNMIKMIAAQYGDEKAHNTAVRKDYQTLAGVLDKEDQMQMNYDLKLQEMGFGLAGVGGDPEMIKNWAETTVKTGQLPPELKGMNRTMLVPIRMQIGQYINEHYTAEQRADGSIAYKAKQAAATSGGQTTGRILARSENIMDNLNDQIGPALDASRNVPRGRFVPLNKLVQGGKVMTSNPDYYDFATEGLQLAELWARAMNLLGNTMRESDRQIALDRLNTAASPEAFRRVVKDIYEFVQREKRNAEKEKAAIGRTGPAPQSARPPGLDTPIPTARGPSPAGNDGWGDVTVH